jgi:hypothetical protein
VPDHPDREQLAAYEASDGDRRQQARIEAHLSGCPACAEVVATVSRARQQLAVLDEPEFPAGLHDRLAAAVAAEQDSEVVALRRPAWWQRPAAWGAAAAILLAAILLPLLRLGGNDDTVAGGGTAAESNATQGQLGRPAVLTLPGEFTPARLRVLLAANRDARQALQDQGAAETSPPAAPGRAAPAQGGEVKSPPAADTPPGLADACVAAASQAAGRPVQAAFVLQTRYRGQEATLLVAPVPGSPGRADVYAFPRDDCSVPPLSTERVG